MGEKFKFFFTIRKIYRSMHGKASAARCPVTDMAAFLQQPRRNALCLAQLFKPDSAKVRVKRCNIYHIIS